MRMWVDMIISSIEQVGANRLSWTIGPVKKISLRDFRESYEVVALHFRFHGSGWFCLFCLCLCIYLQLTLFAMQCIFHSINSWIFLPKYSFPSHSESNWVVFYLILVYIGSLEFLAVNFIHPLIIAEFI